MATESYRTFLAGELKRRQRRNHRYSLRAFARDLGISATAISQAFQDKRDLSRRSLLKAASRLNLDAATAEEFLAQITVRERGAGCDSDDAELAQLREPLERVSAPELRRLRDGETVRRRERGPNRWTFRFLRLLAEPLTPEEAAAAYWDLRGEESELRGLGLKAARFLSGANTTTRRVSSSFTMPMPDQPEPLQLSIPREYTLSRLGAAGDAVYNITFRHSDLARPPYPGVHLYHGSVLFSRFHGRLAMVFTLDLIAEESVIGNRIYHGLVSAICGQAFSSHAARVQRGPTLRQLKALRLALS